MNENEFDLIIEPSKGSRQYWKDIWRYRELLVFLAWKDVLVRYKQTVIGIAWSLLRPLLTMFIFVLVFNKVAKLDSSNAPYPILVFAALLPWQLFSTSLADSSNSLILNSNLVSKVYFPRMLIPISTILVCVIDFMISLAVLIGMMLFYSYPPELKIFLLIPITCLTFLTSLGAGIFFAALNVRYRDFRYVIPFVIQFGLYVSPVGFDSSIIPEKWRLIFYLNPMVGIIDGFRWSILKDMPFPSESLLFSFGITLILLYMGITYFRATEKSFADKI